MTKQIAEKVNRCALRVQLGETKVRRQRLLPKTSLKELIYKAHLILQNHQIPTMTFVRKKKPDIDSCRRS